MGKKILDSKILYILISVILSVSLWFYVISLDGNEDEKTIRNIPITFAHGKKDRFVPYTMCEENFAACASEKSVFYSENAEHGMSFLENQDELLAVLRGFFASHDNLTEV